MKSILIIAGSDSSGGAGIQADIKTAYKLGYHPATVISALTAQNSVRVLDIMPIPKRFILNQIKAVLEDMVPDAVKIGMLFSLDAITAVVDMFSANKIYPIVLDPLIQASTGAALLEEGGIEKIKKVLFPTVNIITPNKYEAELLSNIKISNLKDLENAAMALHEEGAGLGVVITGYYKKDRIIDLIYDGRDLVYIEDSALDITHGHGSGCVFSTSMAIFLSEGNSFQKAAQLAHEFTKSAIKRGHPLGKGSGPVYP